MQRYDPEIWRLSHLIRRTIRMQQIMAIGFLLLIFGAVAMINARTPYITVNIDGNTYQSSTMLKVNTGMLLCGQISFGLGLALVVLALFTWLVASKAPKRKKAPGKTQAAAKHGIKQQDLATVRKVPSPRPIPRPRPVA